MEARSAAADVGGLKGQAVATIGTGVGGTWVSLLARLPWGWQGEGSGWPPHTPYDGEGPIGINQGYDGHLSTLKGPRAPRVQVTTQRQD